MGGPWRGVLAEHGLSLKFWRGVDSGGRRATEEDCGGGRIWGRILERSGWGEAPTGRMGGPWGILRVVEDPRWGQFS